jgi:hypothetical protein
MAKLGDNFVLAEKPSLLFGGISATFFHAVKTEAFLVGKSLNDVQVANLMFKLKKWILIKLW